MLVPLDDFELDDTPPPAAPLEWFVIDPLPEAAARPLRARPPIPNRHAPANRWRFRAMLRHAIATRLSDDPIDMAELWRRARNGLPETQCNRLRLIHERYLERRKDAPV